MNEWILRLIEIVLKSASPELRQFIIDWVKEIEAKAKETPNPWDDVLVGLIKVLLNVNTNDS